MTRSISPLKILSLIKNFSSKPKEISSPEETSRNHEYKRRNDRKGLIRIITGRIKEKNEKDSLTESSSNSNQSK